MTLSFKVSLKLFLQENCSAAVIQSLSEIVFSCTIRVGENGSHSYLFDFIGYDLRFIWNTNGYQRFYR
jgi:hypothetical protein